MDGLFQFNTLTVIALLVFFYGGTFWVSTRVGKKQEKVDGYMLAGSNVVGSVISLMSNFIAGGVLISLLSPFNFIQGVLIVASGVLPYTLWSGFRASVLTDFIQVVAMLGAVAVLVPVIFFAADFPAMFEAGASDLTPQQSNFFSSDAFMNQGAPYIAAVLAYAIGNQTTAQRLFAVRKDLIKPTFITETIGYGAMVIGVGMLGVMALYLGVSPLEGDPNNLIPQMAANYLPPILLTVFFIMIVGALSSTADSDLSALSSIVMAGIYGQSVGKNKADPKLMLALGRLSMVLASTIAVILASIRLNILDLLVFVGALWGVLVFPVVASFYWKKVTNSAFTVAVIAALAVFLPMRFSLVSLNGGVGLIVDVLASIGVGVVLGLMAFGFFGLRPALIIAGIATLAVAPFAFGTLHTYATLSASLVAYSVSTLVCAAMSWRSNTSFDFAKIQKHVGDFDDRDLEEQDRPDDGDQQRQEVTA